MRMTRILLLAAFVGLAASLAYGQEPAPGSTRSDQLAAEREKKAEHTSSPERSKVERALYWYDNQDLLAKIQSGWNGFRMASRWLPCRRGDDAWRRLQPHDRVARRSDASQPHRAQYRSRLQHAGLYAGPAAASRWRGLPAHLSTRACGPSITGIRKKTSSD